MDQEEWDGSGADYRCEALLAIRSLIVLEDEERSAKAFSKRPFAFFARERDRTSQTVEEPIALMLSEASSDFCVQWARMIQADEAGWDALRLGVVELLKLPMGQGFTGWKTGRNLDALLEGLDANPQAPAGFADRLGVDMVEAAWVSERALRSNWGMLGAGARRWGRAWLDWARSQEADAEGRKALVEDQGLRVLATHWEAAAFQAMGEEGSAALAASAAAMDAMEEVALQAEKEGLATREAIDQEARKPVADALGRVARLRQNSKERDMLEAAFAGVSERMWSMAIEEHDSSRDGGSALAWLEAMLLKKQWSAGAGRKRGAPGL